MDKTRLLSLSELTLTLRYPHEQLASASPKLSSALDRSQTAADGHSLVESLGSDLAYVWLFWDPTGPKETSGVFLGLGATTEAKTRARTLEAKPGSPLHLLLIASAFS